MSERLNVDELGGLLLHLQALDQPAEHPEVVPAGRTEGLLARLVQLDPLALAVLSSLGLHGLSIVEEVEEDCERGLELRRKLQTSGCWRAVPRHSR